MDETEGLRRFPLARRTFVMSSLISGLTMATAHGDTPAIHTGGDGLVAGETSLPVADGTLPAYLARPDGAGPSRIWAASPSHPSCMPASPTCRR